MSKIPFMKLEDIEAIRSNAKNYLHFFSNQDNSWLESTLNHSPFGETKYDLPDIVFYMPEEEKHSPSTDKQNVREIYEKLRWLSDSQASDERLWAGLCFGPFWDYVHYRWKIETPESIKQHYLFAYNPRRSLTRNALSRLWWIGRLTYDVTREDPFELTDFVCENSRFIVDVLERNVSNSKPLMREFLGACVDSKKSGLKMDTNTIRELEKYLDLLGGIYVLDYMPEKFVYNKILNKAQELMLAQGGNTDAPAEENATLEESAAKITPANKVVLPTSIIIATEKKGIIVSLNLKKQHFHTKPKSLIGKRVGDTFMMSSQMMTITDIK